MPCPVTLLVFSPYVAVMSECTLAHVRTSMVASPVRDCIIPTPHSSLDRVQVRFKGTVPILVHTHLVEDRSVLARGFFLPACCLLCRLLIVKFCFEASLGRRVVLLFVVSSSWCLVLNLPVALVGAWWKLCLQAGYCSVAIGVLEMLAAKRRLAGIRGVTGQCVCAVALG